MIEVVEVVHRHGDAAARRLEHFPLDHLAVLAGELDGDGALAGELEVGGAVLVAVGVAADDDGLRPAGHQARHVLADDGLAEDDAAQDVADGAVGRAPHLLEAELFDAALVGGDGGALDGHAVLLGGVGGVDGDLVVGRVAVLDAEVVVFEVHVEVGVDQLVLDQLPDDACHLVAVHLDDRAGDLDLLHGWIDLAFRASQRVGRLCPRPYSIGAQRRKVMLWSQAGHASTDARALGRLGGRRRASSRAGGCGGDPCGARPSGPMASTSTCAAAGDAGRRCCCSCMAFRSMRTAGPR